MKIARWLRGDASPVRMFILRADAARDEKRWRDAAALYREALRLEPKRAGVHVQAGHMLKEAGDFDAAEQHYEAAAALIPDDADLALQFGHFYKLTGRLADAARAYKRAAALAPGWDAPRLEIERAAAMGLSLPEDALAPTPASDALYAQDPLLPPIDPKVAGAYGHMAPERLPRPFRDMVKRSEPSINIVQFGVPMNTYWGLLPVTRGVEAIRGFCIAAEELTEVTALVNGLVIHRGPLKGPYELGYEHDPSRIHKYVFNIWADLSRLALGRHALELRFRDVFLRSRSMFQEFVVETPLIEADHPDSDGVVTLAPDDPRPVAEQINARPAIVHEAARPTTLPEIRTILVTRPDQLGDLIASIPAVTRLRALFPDARLVGLFGPANVDLARTLGLFDETVVVDYRESMALRTRTLTWEQQEQLRDTLAPYSFDLAIDLASSTMSRPLLALSGAPFTYGFKDPDWPRLSASVDDAYHDPKNDREIAPHSTRILAMIERLGTLRATSARVIRRDDLARDRLEAIGIGAGDRFAVLHTGARIRFSRWSHYPALAARLHRDTGLKIVLFADGPQLRDQLPGDIASSDRVIVIDRQLPFDDFDALLSYCDVYVGNDSGPKHLAALRGVPVVSIHSARVNWNEWGQEQTGVVVSRKVPCAGCLIYHDVDECGADFACVTAIGIDDVYGAVRRFV